MPAPDDVQVQVIHGLAAIRPAVNGNAKAARRMLLADLRCTVQQVTQYFSVGLLYVRQRPNLAPGYDQDMYRCDRGNVVKCEAQVVLKDFLARDFTREDATEDG